MEHVWQEGLRPIVCKLTDFVENCSSINSDQYPSHIKVTKVDKGNPAYMPHEIILKEKSPRSVTLVDLQMFHDWALWMICFVLVNPCFRYPYENEIHEAVSLCPAEDARTILECLNRSCQSSAGQVEDSNIADISDF